MTESPGASESAAAVVDPDRPPIGLPDALLQDVWQHALECHPEEACGLLLGPIGVEHPTVIERCRNVQNRRKLAGESHLDARHGFWIDEKELLDALKRADQRGHELKVIYHSHVNAGAYLSLTDRDAALAPDRRPLWPGVAHLVVGVNEHGVSETGCYVWDDQAEAFLGAPVVSVET